MTKRKRPQTMTMERRLITPGDVEKMQIVCIWKGCEQSIPLTGMRPPDWHNLITYWSPYLDGNKTLEEVCTGPSCYRDGVLCPEHAKALDGLFKEIAREITGPAAGEA